MTWNPATLPAVRGRLSRYLGRLRHSLDAVGDHTRQSVADAVGRTVAEAVGDAVHDALAPRAPFASSSTARRSPEFSSLARRDYDEPAWDREADRALWHDPYADDDIDQDTPRSYLEPEPEGPGSGPVERRPRSWREALAAGVQAAAWWLRRRRGPASLLAALAVGVVAALTVLIGPVGHAAGLVASALGLAYLLDLLRSACDLLGPEVSPPWTRS